MHRSLKKAQSVAGQLIRPNTDPDRTYLIQHSRNVGKSQEIWNIYQVKSQDYLRGLGLIHHGSQRAGKVYRHGLWVVAEISVTTEGAEIAGRHIAFMNEHLKKSYEERPTKRKNRGLSEVFDAIEQSIINKRKAIF